MTVKELTDSMIERLVPLYGKGEADAMLRIIWEKMRGWQPVDIVLHGEDVPGISTMNDMEEIVSRVEKGEPLQYVLGSARFFGLALKVTPAVLIPRPETEGLVQMIVDDNDSRPDMRVLDVCTGSGAIGVALARNLPFAKVTAVDISAPALKVAAENASSLKVKVKLIQEDVLSAATFGDDYDIVVSNPPYVLESERSAMHPNVLDHEPHDAIFAPAADPVVFYRVIARKAFDALCGGGRLYFELNPLTAEDVARCVREIGFDDAQLLPDIHGRTRYLKAIRPKK